MQHSTTLTMKPHVAHLVELIYRQDSRFIINYKIPPSMTYTFTTTTARCGCGEIALTAILDRDERRYVMCINCTLDFYHGWMNNTIHLKQATRAMVDYTFKDSSHCSTINTCWLCIDRSSAVRCRLHSRGHCISICSTCIIPAKVQIHSHHYLLLSMILSAASLPLELQHYCLMLFTLAALK